MDSAAEHPFKEILTALPKPGGGEFGKFYSLPALNDPRIGIFSTTCYWNLACVSYMVALCYKITFCLIT